MVEYGLGLMRLPLLDDNDQASVDLQELQIMVDKCMEEGVNFFDTAVPYHMGASEESIKKTLVEKYPRDSFILSNKLPLFYITKKEDMEFYFNQSLNKCGVDYFDYYMLHNLSTWIKSIYKKIDCFKFLKEKKDEGLVNKIGISFHDRPKLLKKTLAEHHELDFILLQINYHDWDSQSFQARESYKIALEYDLEILIMEPLKGGTLINITDKAIDLLKEYNPNDSIASWAMRFSGSLDNVSYVLSGTKNLQQTSENINTFKNFKPISLKEIEILNKVSEILDEEIAIECTECDIVWMVFVQIIYLYQNILHYIMMLKDLVLETFLHKGFNIGHFHLMIYMVVHLIVMDVVNVLKYALKVLRFHYF